jgi:hypothetical protein
MSYEFHFPNSNFTVKIVSDYDRLRLLFGRMSELFFSKRLMKLQFIHRVWNPVGKLFFTNPSINISKIDIFLWLHPPIYMINYQTSDVGAFERSALSVPADAF